jgi:sugar phosphate isomerase/epimerase
MQASRREFLRRASALGLGAACIPGVTRNVGRIMNGDAAGAAEPEDEDEGGAHVGVALQLYSVRDDCAADFAGTVRKVAEMGYEGVEFAGYYGWTAEDLRKLLDDCGLVAAGAHIGLESMLGDEFEKTVAFHQTIGNVNLMVPGLAAEYTETRAGWQKAADTFSAIAAKLKPLEMWTGYHNHTIEFTPLEGELPWDTFFGRASKDVVMQVDIGNAMSGGGDPVPYIAKYPGRARTVHCKEYKKDSGFAMFGEGDVPWKRVFDLCESIGNTRWYVIEQEVYDVAPIECVERCIEKMREWGKI